jgi:hypothetical protein
VLHKQIDGLNNRVKKTLNEVVKTGKLYGNEGLRGFLSNYRVYCKYDTFLLVEFLKQPKNKKLLHICNMCNKFFISQKDDSRIKYCSSCSPKSKISRERKNELQRIWRQKKKQERLEIQREARIENLMKRVRCSREEAIEYIEADESMM